MAAVAEPVPQEHVRHTKTHARFVEKLDTGRNFAEIAKEQTVRKKTVNSVVTPNRMTNNIGMLANAAVGETEDSMIWSQRSEEDSTEPYDGIRISSVRNEVFTALDVIYPRKKGMRKIKLKVDTGAAGNTPP